MKWISANESLPCEPGKLIVIINGEYLFGLATEFMPYTASDQIYFFLQYTYENTSNPYVIRKVSLGGHWVKPKLYAEITHWLLLPERLDNE